MNLFVFHLDAVRYAIPLRQVERVTRAVEITSLHEGARNLLGIITVRGVIVPVINTRRMMGLPEREIDLDDFFIITHCGRRSVALVADAVEQVVDCPDARYVPVDDILPTHHHFNGFARLDGGVTLIHDLDTCLCPDEAALVDSLHMAGIPA